MLDAKTNPAEREYADRCNRERRFVANRFVGRAQADQGFAPSDVEALAAADAKRAARAARRRAQAG